MNVPDLETDNALSADYVLALLSASGEAKQVCVRCGSSGPARPLFLLMEKLVLCGMAWRGGGSPQRRREYEAIHALGAEACEDWGQPLGDLYAGGDGEDDADDPFTDYCRPASVTRSPATGTQWLREGAVPEGAADGSDSDGVEVIK